MLRLHYLQHVSHETPAHIARWAATRGHALDGTILASGAPLPSPAAFDWLVVMGGSMGANDDARYPWMAAEKRLIASAIEAGRTVIGFCLGAQLLARVLGARVYPHTEREIGWYPIRRVAAAAAGGAFAALPDELTVLHWHGDTFDLPPGAVWTYRSEVCDHQGFYAGKGLYGLQFHLEVSAVECHRWIREDAREFVTPSRHVSTPATLLADAAIHAAPSLAALERFLDAVAAEPLPA